MLAFAIEKLGIASPTGKLRNKILFQSLGQNSIDYQAMASATYETHLTRTFTPRTLILKNKQMIMIGTRYSCYYLE
jgi:hypothetical protein